MRLIPVVFLSLLLCACVIPGQSSYRNDPFTGGVDARTSALLNIPLPPGLQYYPSHSRISGGARKEGLETLRGYVNQTSCGSSFYGSLRQAGWNLRMHQKAGSRAIYVYEKDSELAALVFQAQGALTIVQVWLGARLVDNAALPFAPETPDAKIESLPGESFGPMTGAEEKWGVEEREL